VLLCFLLLTIELIAGFVLILGSGLQQATSFGYAVVWPVFFSGMAGLASSLLILHFAPKPPRDRVILLTAALLVAGVPSYISTSDLAPGLVDSSLLVLAFWRGVAVTYEPPSHEDVYERFGTGFSLFFLGIVCIVARGLMGSASIWQSVAVAGIAYVGLAMLALGIARLEEEREPGALLAVSLAIAAQILLLMVLGLGAAQVFSIDLFGWFGHHVQPVSNAVGATVWNMLPRFSDGPYAFLRHVRPLLPKPRELPLPLPGNQTAHLIHAKIPPRKHPSSFPFEIVALTVFAILVGAIGLRIWRSAPHRSPARPRPERRYRERREPAMSWSDAWTALLLFLRGLFRRSVFGANHSLASIRKRVWGAAYPQDPIRRAYAKLLRRSAAAGMPRPVGLTPQEFAPLLSSRWAEGTDEIGIITDAYTVQRYAAASLPAGQLDRVEADWQRLRRLMHVPWTRRET